MKTRLILAWAMAIAVVALSSCDTLDPSAPGQLVPLTVDEDPTLPAISVNGTRLHAETFGNPGNPLLVVLHGGPGGDYRYMLNCRAFANDGFYVVFFDQRGSGLSRRHERSTYASVQIFIDDLDAVIKHYRSSPGQKVALLGQSWGAMLATAYVNQHPDEVSGVILCEPGGFTWQDAKDFAARCRPVDLFSEPFNDYVTIDQILTSSDHAELDYKAAVQSAAAFAPGNKLGQPGPFPFWRMGAVCSSAAAAIAKEHPFDFTVNLGQFTKKILFCYSELDAAYGKAYAEHVSSAYPSVELVEIMRSAHEIPCFGWDGFYPVARDYLHSIK
jgi:proline iminopeptidase